MTFDPTKPVANKHGPAKILEVKECGGSPIIAAYLHKPGGWSVGSFTDEGRYWIYRTDDLDLFNIEEPEQPVMVPVTLDRLREALAVGYESAGYLSSANALRIGKGPVRENTLSAMFAYLKGEA